MQISLRAVRKRYRSLPALDDVSFEIEPGAIVAVLGANGAGKTTLLRALAGVVAPDRGEILFDEELFRRDRLDLRRRLLFLPDFPPVFVEMTPLQHAAMVLHLYDVTERGVEERLLEALRDLSIVAVADLPMGRLSRGELYKAVLAPLLVIQPELWLLDEPFASGMDPAGIGTLRRRAAEAKKHGCTIVYTTQIVEVAQRFCDRVCVLHQGAVVALDSFDVLRQRARAEGGVLEQLLGQLEDGRA